MKEQNQQKRVFIYARRSDKRKKWKSVSIDNQIQDLQYECDKKWFIVEKIIEENQSWYIPWARNDFNSMIEELKNRNIRWKWNYIDYVFVKMPSRLSRNSADTKLILDLLEQEVVEIYSLSDGFVKWVIARKKFEHDLIEAKYFSEERSIEWKSDMDSSTKEKWTICWNVPFWYRDEWRKEYRKVLINNNNNEANIVKEIFEEYSTWKYTWKSLANHLNLKWYQKTSVIKGKIVKKEFDGNSVYAILQNERYCWIYKITYEKLKKEDKEYFKKEYPQIEIINNTITIDYTDKIKEFWTFPPIISKYLFNACKNIKQWIKNKNYSEKKRKWEEVDDYIFKWIIRCNCKKEVDKNRYNWLHFTAEKAKKIYDSYKCSNNNTKWLKCDNTWLSWIKAENIFIENFIKWIKFWELEMKIFQEIISKQLEDLNEWSDDIWKNLDTKLKNLNIQKSKYMDNYVNEDDEDFKKDIKEKINKIKEDIKIIEEEIEKLSKVSTKKDITKRHIEDYIFYISSLWEKFENFPKFRKKELIQAMFEYVVIYKWEVLEYKLNPVFDLAFKQKKFDVFSKVSKKKSNETSNSNISTNKGKNDSLNSNLFNGIPDKDRTCV